MHDFSIMSDDPELELSELKHHEQQHATRSPLDRPSALRTRLRPHSTGTVVPSVCMTIRSFYNAPQGITMYNIDVEQGTSTIFTIRRRFSDFRKLHEMVAQIDRSCPALPSYGVVWTLRKMVSNDDRVFESRMFQLQMILDRITKNAELAFHPCVFEFIGQAPCAQDTGYVSLARFGTPNVDLSDEIRSLMMRKRAISAPSLAVLSAAATTT